MRRELYAALHSIHIHMLLSVADLVTRKSAFDHNSHLSVTLNASFKR